MIAVLVFAVTLLLAVLLPERTGRSILSTAALFLAAGFAANDGMLELIILTPQNPVVKLSPSWRYSACCSPTACR